MSGVGVPTTTFPYEHFVSSGRGPPGRSFRANNLAAAPCRASLVRKCPALSILGP